MQCSNISSCQGPLWNHYPETLVDTFHVQDQRHGDVSVPEGGGLAFNLGRLPPLRLQQLISNYWRLLQYEVEVEEV